MSNLRRALPVLFALLLTVACDRNYESERHNPTGLDFQNALAVTPASITLAADGFSTAEISATVSPSADTANRVIEFITTDGSFVEAAAATPKVTEQAIDGSGKAVVHLRSSQQVGNVSVTVRVKAQPTIARIVNVTFTPTSPDTTIKLSVEKDSIPADKFTSTAVFADVDAGVPSGSRTVTFTTTRGTFLSTGNTTATATADQSGRARVDLVAPQNPSTARVTATVFNVTRETSVEFVAALPESIIVQPDKLAIKATADADGSTTLTIRMARSIGAVSLGLIPVINVVDADTGTPLPLIVRNVVATNAEGVAQAVLTAGPTTFRGVARIEVRVAGSTVVGTANIEITAPPST